MEEGFDDEETEQTVTIGEVIEGLEAQELEADLVLGGDEGTECTYSKGYMKRQAIFSCLTCVPDGNAGVCIACVLSCHDGHEVVELWTKRNFKCDCGNSKFGAFSCKLCPSKDPENAKNAYNKNFKGSYCTCSRPYPDPDAEEQVEMIQCCICEDWFHENHLSNCQPEEIPRDEEGEPLFDEFICEECTAIYPFIGLYSTTRAVVNQKNPDVTSNGTIFQEDGFSSHTGPANSKSIIVHLETTVNYPNSEHDILPEIVHDTKNSELEKVVDLHEISVADSGCILGLDINTMPLKLKGNKPLFFPKKWRDLLCRCKTCLEFYEMKDIGFLIEKEDTIDEYEKIAKEKREENLLKEERAEMNFFNSLGHVQKIEICKAFDDMKTELSSYLASMDSNVVTAADVECIFKNIAEKRRRLQ